MPFDVVDVEQPRVQHTQLTKLCVARANGGHLFHIVNITTGIALCGHKPPKKSGYSKMKQRGKWLRYDREVTCPTCKEKNDLSPTA